MSCEKAGRGAGDGEPATPANGGVLRLEPRLRVGCALLAKKVSRYLTPRMLETAERANIELVQIDWGRSLLQQGPFNIIIHKLRPDPAWEARLAEYQAADPGVCIVDRLDRIRALHNRATMLTPLKGKGITLVQPLPPQCEQRPQRVRVQAPPQVEIAVGTTEAQAQAALAAAGLEPPLLCKPLWTDGREGSHGLAVLHDLEELGRLMRGAVSSEFKPPLVVQQFVEHGGVLHKVYVLGGQTVVTARPSLGEAVLEAEQGVQQLPRISCVSVFSKHVQQQQRQAAAAGGGCCRRSDPGTAAAVERRGGAMHASSSASNLVSAAAAAAAASGECADPRRCRSPPAGSPGSPPASLAAAASAWQPPPSATTPPEWVTATLAATLRRELGMQLFNFDLLVPEQQQQQLQQQQQQGLRPGEAPPLLYVVDINYFPGVDKIPDFEERFVAFLRAAAESPRQRLRQEQQREGEQQQQQQQARRQAGAAAATGGADAARAAIPAPPPAGVGGGRHAGGSGSRSSSGSGPAALGFAGDRPRQQQQQQHRPPRGTGVSGLVGTGGLDVSSAASGPLGSSPPQLQVAGCS